MFEQLTFIKKENQNKRQDFVANVFRQLGSTNHSLTDREENDFYATDPLATYLLCEKERFSTTVWEPYVGMGHIAEVLKQCGYNVKCSDIVDRGYVSGGVNLQDFLAVDITNNKFDIVTNPPYKLAGEFAKHALDISVDGVKVAMFLKIQFLESAERYELFKQYPPKYIYVASKRLNCAKDGDFDKYTSSAICYAWFVWIKGFDGEPTIRWINTPTGD